SVVFGQDQTYYEALFGKALGELSAEETQRRYVTSFILWTNYDIEEAYVERISANYLLAFVMERLGIQTSAYQKYLMELYEKVPAMNLYGYYDTQGRFYTWDQVGEVTSVLNEYRILQYNNLFDKKHQLKGFFE
ncbi:MAG: LTA synthase family protein, partial [Eubacteriales bacterium]|nr:LTA synthase family protein [Eubacteriales bacterium]